MHYPLSHIPPRPEKPRASGLTMVMDKGLSTREAEDLLSTSAYYIDFVKLGWATSYVSPNLKEKLDLYRSAGVPCYFGGTLFELFLIRDQLEEYRRILKRFNMEYVEVSDGSLEMAHDEKCAHIRTFAQDFRVLSEVGSKDAEKIIAPYKWIAMMKAELEAGSERVIAEAREAGNVGIFRSTGEVRSGLVDEILTQIPAEKILWEAPHKAQQTWFIKLIGCDVNLGNIASNDVIPLETLRLGLRSDTFHHFLPK
ncbi:MAG: phosphosulfolactate synthase [Bacteroidota bacterium]